MQFVDNPVATLLIFSSEFYDKLRYIIQRHMRLPVA